MTALFATVADPPSLSFPITSPVVWVGMVVLGLPLLISALNGVLNVINFFRKNPPDHSTYATKGELQAMEVRLKQEIEESSVDLDSMEERQNQARSEMERRLSEKLTRVDAFETSVQRELREIGGQLGKLFGLLENRKGGTR